MNKHFVCCDIDHQSYFIKLLESPIPTAAAAAPPAPPSQKAHFALCIAPSVVP